MNMAIGDDFQKRVHVRIGREHRAIPKSVMKMAIGDDFQKRVHAQEEKQSNSEIGDEYGHW